MHTFVTVLLLWCNVELVPGLYDDDTVNMHCEKVIGQHVKDNEMVECMCASTHEFNTCKIAGKHS